MEIIGPFGGNMDPSDLPEEIMLGLMLLKGDFCTSATVFEHDAKPTRAQYDLKPGDAGFLTRSDSMVDLGFCALLLVDPEPYAALFPNWGDRIRRDGLVLAKWSHVEDPEPTSLGWFSRAKIVPLPDGEMFLALQEYIAGLEEPEDFDSDTFEFLDPAYRKMVAEQLPQNDKDVEALTCESCGSTNAVVRVWHNSFVEATGAWQVDEEGNRLLRQASLDHSDCTVQAEIACYDCGWEREAQESEFAPRLAHHNA